MPAASVFAALFFCASTSALVLAQSASEDYVSKLQGSCINTIVGGASSSTFSGHPYYVALDWTGSAVLTTDSALFRQEDDEEGSLTLLAGNSSSSSFVDGGSLYARFNMIQGIVATSRGIVVGGLINTCARAQ
jgi:hypothetical protein